MQVIELDEANPIAVYDLSTNADQPEIQQVSTDKTYLNNIESGIERLKRADNNADTENELRLLRFPALNMEALWLTGDNRENDKYYPLRHFEDRSL